MQIVKPRTTLKQGQAKGNKLSELVMRPWSVPGGDRIHRLSIDRHQGKGRPKHREAHLTRTTFQDSLILYIIYHV